MASSAIIGLIAHFERTGWADLAERTGLPSSGRSATGSVSGYHKGKRFGGNLILIRRHRGTVLRQE